MLRRVFSLQLSLQTVRLLWGYFSGLIFKYLFVNWELSQESNKLDVFLYAVKSFQVLSTSFIRVRFQKGFEPGYSAQKS